jgi:hypothetical protein
MQRHNKEIISRVTPCTQHACTGPPGRFRNPMAPRRRTGAASRRARGSIQWRLRPAAAQGLEAAGPAGRPLRRRCTPAAGPPAACRASPFVPPRPSVRSSPMRPCMRGSGYPHALPLQLPLLPRHITLPHAPLIKEGLCHCPGAASRREPSGPARRPAQRIPGAHRRCPRLGQLRSDPGGRFRCFHLRNGRVRARHTPPIPLTCGPRCHRAPRGIGPVGRAARAPVPTEWWCARVPSAASTL